MHVIGGVVLAFILLGVTLVLGGCGLQRLEDFPQNASEWKTTVQKTREARNANPKSSDGE